MADYDSTRQSSPPQPLDAQDILREVDQVERDCAAFLFPHRRIRARSKSTAERRQIAEARAELYERSQGLCELRLSPKCWVRITFETMHTCPSSAAPAAEHGISTISKLAAQSVTLVGSIKAASPVRRNSLPPQMRSVER
jgi:hypothetical protein